VKVADQQLVTLAAATPEALRSAQALAARLTELVGVLDAAAPKLVELDEAIGAVGREVALASELVRALEAVHVPGAARSLGADLVAARSALHGAELDREAAAAEVERASAALAGLPTPDSLRAALAIHDDLDGVRASLAQAEERRRQAAAAVAESSAVVANAERALAHAEALHEEARQRFAAHLLASGLEPGAPCPVCGQDVHEAVAIDPPADLGSRRERLDAARAALDAGRERHRRDEVVAERALATIEELQARAAAVEVRLGDDHDRGALVELVGRVTAVYEQVARARQREQQCAEVVTKGRQAVHDLQAEAAALGVGYHAQRDRVASLGPPVPGDDVLVAWDALAHWADQERPVQAATLDRAERSRAELTTRRSMLVDALAAEASAAGVVAPPDVSQLHRAATHALARAAEQVAALERQIELAARLTIERDQAREEAAVAGELGRLLSARGFERWMVAEALQRLAYGASVTLRTLSGGQFSLVLGEDGEFSVTDHANGDEVRPVRTLSGGETFQASLALALALADQLSSLAASGAAKLDAMFLDEGFGTLDPESLDTVAATIESLGSAGRMVGIVTHVRELAARVPVRYEVRKGSATSTVERVAG
jgi:exonuclease SbcC